MYFRAPGQGISRVAVNTDGGFRTVGEPESVVTAPYTAEFDVSPDGRYLAVAGTSVSLSAPSARVATIVWWQNWAQSLPEPEEF
jgi:hypothetical protein